MGEKSNVDMFCFERELREKGARYIAGVDEVGRGCLAGPVYAAAVILPFDTTIQGIKDSKKLTPKKKDELFELISAEALCYSFGYVEPAEIDRINILQATLKAMEIAVEGLSICPDHLLIDGNQRIRSDIPQLTITKGDSRSISVAAASIMAKVTRDRMMAGMDAEFPSFTFSVHKGYGTAAHYSEIRANGATSIHRMTFRLGEDIGDRHMPSSLRMQGSR